MNKNLFYALNLFAYIGISACNSGDMNKIDIKEAEKNAKAQASGTTIEEAQETITEANKKIATGNTVIEKAKAAEEKAGIVKESI